MSSHASLLVGSDALGAGIQFAVRAAPTLATSTTVQVSDSVKSTPPAALQSLLAALDADGSVAAYVTNDVLPAFAAHDKKALFHFNSHLLLRPFLVGYADSAADLVLVPAVRPVVAAWAEREQVMFGNITRWFNHIQHLPAVLAQFPQPLALVEDAPTPQAKSPKDAAVPNKDTPAAAAAAAAAAATDAKKDAKKADAPTKADKPAKQAKGADAAAATTAAATTSEADTGSKKKGKGGGGGGGGAAAAPERANDDVTRLNLLVGKIVDIKKHPDADSLYVEQIDLGEASGPRTVVSGLVKYVPIEEMRDRLVVVVANLKPTNLKGIKSFGMVLCGKNEAGDVVEPVDVAAGSKIGERLVFDGATGEADESIDPKKKVWPDVQPGLHTNDAREATYKGAVMRTSAGAATCKTLKAASLS